jgi:hypothetical protein
MAKEFPCKRYLGDGIYVEAMSRDIKLTLETKSQFVEQPNIVHQTIFFDVRTTQGFLDYVQDVKEWQDSTREEEAKETTMLNDEDKCMICQYPRSAHVNKEEGFHVFKLPSVRLNDEQAIEKQQIAMYGCTQEELQAGTMNQLLTDVLGPHHARLMTAMSILSDAQELLQRNCMDFCRDADVGDAHKVTDCGCNEIRQLLNRAKFLMTQVFTELPTKEDAEQPCPVAEARNCRPA